MSASMNNGASTTTTSSSSHSSSSSSTSFKILGLTPIFWVKQILHILSVIWLWSRCSIHYNSPITHLLRHLTWFIIGVFCADIISGVVHYSLDNWDAEGEIGEYLTASAAHKGYSFSQGCLKKIEPEEAAKVINDKDMKSKIIKDSQELPDRFKNTFLGAVFQFQMHHVYPLSICDHDVDELCSGLFETAFLLVLVGYYLTSPPSLTLGTIIVGPYINCFHMMAHSNITPKCLRWLFLSPERHSRHHRSVHCATTRYHCILMGRMDWAIDALDWFIQNVYKPTYHMLSSSSSSSSSICNKKEK